MSVANSEVVRVDVIASWNASVDVVNSYQFRLVTAGLTAEEVLEDIKEIVDALLAILRALSTVLLVFERIRVQNLSTLELQGEVAPGAGTVEGTATGDPGPSGVAALALFPTNIPRVVLRKFWGPLSENNLGPSGQLQAAAVTILTDALVELLQDHVQTNGEWEYGFLSPKAGAWIRPLVGTISVVPAYQRRRRLGTGS